MTENERSASKVSASAAAPPPRKKAPSRRRTVARKKPPARKRAASGARAANALASLLADLSRRARVAGRGIAATSEESVSGARRALARAGTSSKKTVDRLTREWKQMDTKKRVQLVAVLLGALAAASAPIVGRQLKKR